MQIQVDAKTADRWLTSTPFQGAGAWKIGPVSRTNIPRGWRIPDSVLESPNTRFAFCGTLSDGRLLIVDLDAQYVWFDSWW